MLLTNSNNSDWKTEINKCFNNKFHPTLYLNQVTCTSVRCYLKLNHISDYFSARVLWHFLGSYTTFNYRGLYLTSLLHFLDRLIDVGASRHQKQLVEALGVLFGKKLFVETNDDNESLSAFCFANWETIDVNFFDKELQKTPFEIVVAFLTRVLENVPEVFQRLHPMVNSLVDATLLSQTGNLRNF